MLVEFQYIKLTYNNHTPCKFSLPFVWKLFLSYYVPHNLAQRLSNSLVIHIPHQPLSCWRWEILHYDVYSYLFANNPRSLWVYDRYTTFLFSEELRKLLLCMSSDLSPSVSFNTILRQLVYLYNSHFWKYSFQFHILPTCKNCPSGNSRLQLFSQDAWQQLNIFSWMVLWNSYCFSLHLSSRPNIDQYTWVTHTCVQSTSLNIF